MRYGHFDDAAREYVITDPRTPVKWINYVGTLAFGGFVDHTGGALICRGDPATNRITRYIALQPSSDFKGTTLYLRFPRDGQYVVISPFYVPTLEPCDLYECHRAWATPALSRRSMESEPPRRSSSPWRNSGW